MTSRAPEPASDTYRRFQCQECLIFYSSQSWHKLWVSGFGVIRRISSFAGSWSCHLCRELLRERASAFGFQAWGAPAIKKHFAPHVVIPAHTSHREHKDTTHIKMNGHSSTGRGICRIHCHWCRTSWALLEGSCTFLMLPMKSLHCYAWLLLTVTGSHAL